MPKSWRVNAKGLLRQTGRELFFGWEHWLTAVALIVVALGGISLTAAHVVAASVAWLGVIPLLLLVTYSVASAHHKIVSGLQAELESSRARESGMAERVSELEEAPRPVIAFQNPRVDGHVHLPALKTHGIFVFGSVTNSQSKPGAGVRAESAIPRIECFDGNGISLIGTIEGRWRSAPSALEKSPFQTHEGAAAIDIPANGTPHEFDLAFKLPLEDHFSMIDYAQTRHPVAKSPAWVKVTIHGANFAPVEARYMVWIDGTKLDATLEQ